jgi:hypothetical protein
MLILMKSFQIYLPWFYTGAWVHRLLYTRAYSSNFWIIIIIWKQWWIIYWSRLIKVKWRYASTWQLPNHINIKKLNANNQKAKICNGLYVLPLILLVSTKGKISNINIATNILITPNNLLGIDLKIA